MMPQQIFSAFNQRPRPAATMFVSEESPENEGVTDQVHQQATPSNSSGIETSVNVAKRTRTPTSEMSGRAEKRVKVEPGAQKAQVEMPTEEVIDVEDEARDIITLSSGHVSKRDNLLGLVRKLYVEIFERQAENAAFPKLGADLRDISMLAPQMNGSGLKQRDMSDWAPKLRKAIRALERELADAEEYDQAKFPRKEDKETWTERFIRPRRARLGIAKRDEELRSNLMRDLEEHLGGQGRD